MKRAWLDLETTGLDPNKHAIHQLALLVDDGSSIHEFSCRIQPHENAVVDPRALEATETEFSDLARGEPPASIHQQLKSFLNQFVNPRDRCDKLVLFGYNVRFDEDFLRAFFRRQNDNFFGSWFWTPAVCVMTLAMERLQSIRPTLPNFKLSTVYGHVIGAPLVNAHDALADITATKELYDALK